MLKDGNKIVSAFCQMIVLKFFISNIDRVTYKVGSQLEILQSSYWS